MSIMLLKPVGKDYLWGGEKLKTKFNKVFNISPLAETWECSAHPDGPSLIVNGRHSGETLDCVLKKHPEYLGTRVRNKELPILVKLIDSAKDLSIQVHPNDTYARQHENDNGKSEMWYVLEAEPNACIYYGFAHEVNIEQVRVAVESGTITKHLQKIPVQKDDVFYMPAGVVHAIGAGIVIAEVQQSSNVTYRVYDFDRIDQNGQKRSLHVEKALDVLHMKASPYARQKQRYMKYQLGGAREILCRCPYFETERILVSSTMKIYTSKKSFEILFCLDGTGYIQKTDENTRLIFSKGECLFIPADNSCYKLYGIISLLKVRV